MKRRISLIRFHALITLSVTLIILRIILRTPLRKALTYQIMNAVDRRVVMTSHVSRPSFMRIILVLLTSLVRRAIVRQRKRIVRQKSLKKIRSLQKRKLRSPT